MVKAPFNFVPLGDKVFFPKWADIVSQDVPFSDGLDGHFYITIKAETPIFIKDALDDHFCKTQDGKYFIPATSIKGEIRSIMKILSFGKMDIDPRMRFAQREWGNDEWYDKIYPLKKNQREIKGGWLYLNEDDGKYYIDEAKIHRISQKEIDAYIDEYSGVQGVNQILRSHFSSECSFDIKKKTKIDDKEFDPKTAAFKYSLLKSEGVGLELFRGLRFEIESDAGDKQIHNRLTYNPSGMIRGDIVFTGQPDKAKNWDGPRQKNGGKFYEFVFEDMGEEPIEVPEDVFEQHEFIYLNSDSADWDFWKKHLNDGSKGIPVFFRFEDKKQATIKDFGLSLLYKLPYQKTPKQIEQERYAKVQAKGRQYDLSDIIFGCVEDDQITKGRVQFSNCFQVNDVTTLPLRYLTLNGPKASYYPIYIRQGKNDYMTYNDGNLAGWKRYILRDGVYGAKTEENCNKKIDSKVFPLDKGCIFRGRVNYHNLRPAELGALLSALTFHGTPGCYHQLGQAKPYGYGRVSISVEGIPEEKLKDYLLEFERVMKSWEPDWRTYGNVIPELLAISKTVVKADDPDFKYMVLSTDSRINEFADEKKLKPRHYLKSLSSLKRVSVNIGIDDSELEKQQQRKEEESLQLKEERYNVLMKEAQKLLENPDCSVGNCDKAIDLINQAALIFVDRDEPSKLKVKAGEIKFNLANRTNTDVSFETRISPNNYKTVNANVSKWIKDKGALNDDQKEQYRSRIKALYDRSNNHDKKQNFYDFNKKWSTVRDNVGEETALSWYKEITGKDQ